MKLDTKAIRYLTADDWRVLTAVKYPSSLISSPELCDCPCIIADFRRLSIVYMFWQC